MKPIFIARKTTTGYSLEVIDADYSSEDPAAVALYMAERMKDEADRRLFDQRLQLPTLTEAA